ncbi:hypothetical protein C0995_003337 [Termitomyces sp. Mi166|nr:hypothetical protein C0995_003337 [Termitomyces sp. Mi166\
MRILGFGPIHDERCPKRHAALRLVSSSIWDSQTANLRGFGRDHGTLQSESCKKYELMESQPGISDAGMEQLVNDKVDAFWRGIEGGTSRRGQIKVTFSEKRPKKSWFQVYLGEEDVPWEEWIINAELRQPIADREAFNAKLADTLSQAVCMMLTHTSSEQGRAAVPLITNASGISPFPIEISVTVGGMEMG